MEAVRLRCGLLCPWKLKLAVAVHDVFSPFSACGPQTGRCSLSTRLDEPRYGWTKQHPLLAARFLHYHARLIWLNLISDPHRRSYKYLLPGARENISQAVLFAERT